MTKAILFFNHFHRGDLFTSKEFVRQIMEELSPLGFNFDYWHVNPPKILFDVFKPTTYLENEMYTALNELDRNVSMYQSSKEGQRLLLVNTWIGAYPDIFHEEQGVNMRALYRIWTRIFEQIKEFFELENVLEMRSMNDYVPRINWEVGGVPTLKDWNLLAKPSVMFCNGKPMSNQSFDSNMKEIIEEMAQKYPDVVFWCTEDIHSTLPNVYYTDDQIEDDGDYQEQLPFWAEGHKRCTLNEIAWLSFKGDLIVGKNSGPFVFCENRDAYDDDELSFISFGKGEKESMSFDVDKKCRYQLVTDHSTENINRVIREEMGRIYETKT